MHKISEEKSVDCTFAPKVKDVFQESSMAFSVGIFNFQLARTARSRLLSAAASPDLSDRQTVVKCIKSENTPQCSPYLTNDRNIQVWIDSMSSRVWP